MGGRLNIDSEAFRKLYKTGRVKGKGLPEILKEGRSASSNRGVKKVLSGSKYGNKSVSKDDPRNPYGRTFPSIGEFEFQLAIDKAGIENFPQVNLGLKSREYVEGVDLKSYKITVDWYLPSLNVYLDFKGAITDRAIWQFRLLAERFEREFEKEERPYICTVNKNNAESFLIIAKSGNREDLQNFIFDSI